MSSYLAESNNWVVLINLWSITNVFMSEQYVYLVRIFTKEKVFWVKRLRV